MPAAPIIGLVLMLALSTSVVTGPAPPMTSGGGVIVLGGCHPDSPTSWFCMFWVTVSDPSFIFFRWDFNGDGRWDTGSNASGNFIVESTVFYTYRDTYSGLVTVQVWDGISTKDGKPVGPMASKILIVGDTLRISPMWWSRTATGPASALWTPPAGLRVSLGTPRNATLYDRYGTDVPGVALFRQPGPGPVWRFDFDLAAMSRTFGPGTHEVFLCGDWGMGASFSSRATTIMIL